jgi:hypothetical protein
VKRAKVLADFADMIDALYSASVAHTQAASTY